MGAAKVQNGGFMGTKVLSFEIGAKITKICVANLNQKNPKIFQTIVIDTPADAVEDGYIKDIEAVAAAISSAIKKEGIHLTQVVFTISSSKIVNREVIIPFVKENKIKDVIEANATDYFPIDVKEYTLSHIIMEKVNTKELKNYRLLVLAVHSNLLMAYYRLAEILKLKVASIDYVGNSVFQVYQHEATNDTSMFIHINEQSTMVNVMKKDVLELQRVIPYGYDSILTAISENEQLNIKPEDAFTELKEKSYIKSNFSEREIYYNPSEDGEVAPLDPSVEITESLRFLISNVVRVVDYYGTKKKDDRIRSIVLTGQGAQILGLERLFGNEVGIEAKTILSFQGVTFANEKAADDFKKYDFIAVSGASIAPIGMVAKKYMEKVTRKNDMVAVITISSLVALTSIVLWLVSAQQLFSARFEQARLTTEINKMSSINGIYSKNLDLKDRITGLGALKILSYSSNEQLLPLINELEAKLPTQTTVHSITVTGSEVTINFTVDSMETCAMTLTQLKSINLLENVRTAGVTEDKDNVGLPKLSFSVTANYTVPKDITEEAK